MKKVYLGDTLPGVATWGTHFILDVEDNLPTHAAQGVGLVAPFSKGAGSLGHGDFLASEIQAAMRLYRRCTKQRSQQYKQLPI